MNIIEWLEFAWKIVVGIFYFVCNLSIALFNGICYVSVAVYDNYVDLWHSGLESPTNMLIVVVGAYIPTILAVWWFVRFVRSIYQDIKHRKELKKNPPRCKTCGQILPEVTEGNSQSCSTQNGHFYPDARVGYSCMQHLPTYSLFKDVLIKPQFSSQG